ncbi:MAG TPA: maltose ABC transporter substrate-binding protein [Erysipelotrichaceae bacterium]|jgi:arabinogalactan oligomer/maltooligosaccharide transport system substrate-binding protein|nr:extracellular solute-binding protein [Bacillota bacterium]NLP22502.1 extracellular solute-binding protein [Erysipelotrichaceae bacterium]HCY06772.1 maltose ABC transporter substrate-binding protein [Erysipelotrichaceae bacterium]
MKRFISLLLVAMMLLGLVACSSDKPSGDAPATEGAAETVTLRVWGAQDDQEMLQGMIDAFIAANPDTEWDITLGVVSEADAKTKYLEDPAAAADVFAFANDQIIDLVNAGALYKVTRNADDIKARNSEGSIEGSSVDGQLYGYPLTADNGYFLYYDSSVFTKEDVDSLDTMLAKANEAGKKVFMDVSNGWYIASFFLGNGGTFAIDADGNQVVDFNNENGLAAAEAIKAFTADPAFLTGDDSILVAGMGDTIAAGVSGTWNATAMEEALGENYAAAKLPKYTTAAGEVQMGSFVGYKVLGVNSQTKFPEQAMDLADFLSNEENQKLRFETRQLLPSNTVAAAEPAVAENIAIAALQEQNPYGTSQKEVLGTYWAPAEAFGATLEAKDYSIDLQTLLDDMVEQIQTPAGN